MPGAVSCYALESPERSRIEIFRFAKELLRAEGKHVGRFDSRITGVDRDDVSERFDTDPSFNIVHSVYAARLSEFVRSELEFESDLPYDRGT